MTTSPRFFRLCVDLDITGGPIGSSFEVHDGRTVSSVLVMEEPGPFDSVIGVFQELRREVELRYGHQQSLDV